MEIIRRYQVRGIPGHVTRASFAGRIVDYWAPEGGSDHTLIAHDGQNIFDRKTATFLYTWKLAQTAIRVATEHQKRPPLIIGIFHSATKIDPHGRVKDLSPEDPFREGLEPLVEPVVEVDELRGNSYLREIFTSIVPEVTEETSSLLSREKSAMIGSSMGGLATLYAAGKFSTYFQTALALSPHWPIGGKPLVEWMLPKIDQSSITRLWMSRGTKGLDASYPPFQDHADSIMRELGWSESTYRSKVYRRSAHNERSWASYVDEPLRFWLAQPNR